MQDPEDTTRENVQSEQDPQMEIPEISCEVETSVEPPQQGILPSQGEKEPGVPTELEEEDMPDDAPHAKLGRPRGPRRAGEILSKGELILVKVDGFYHLVNAVIQGQARIYTGMSGKRLIGLMMGAEDGESQHKTYERVKEHLAKLQGEHL